MPYDKVLAHKWLSLAAGQDTRPRRVNVSSGRQDDTTADCLGTGRRPAHGEGAFSSRASHSEDRGFVFAGSSTVSTSIREAQALMGALGYKPGPTDGLWGPRTAKAYAAFLRNAGLPPGKVLTQEALRAMRGAAAKENAPGMVAKAGSAASKTKGNFDQGRTRDKGCEIDPAPPQDPHPDAASGTRRTFSVRRRPRG